MAEYLTYLRGYSPVRDDAAYARLDPQFGSRLTAMLQAAPEHVRRPDLIESLYRDSEGQARAIRQVADRMGIPFTPMLLSRGIPGYAAPVGGSRHQSGMAADINWSGLPPEGRDWLRSNAGAYGLRFPLPSTDAGHLELDPDWRGELPVSGAVAERPAAPPPIMNAAMYGMGAERPREPTPNLPPIMSAARMGFRDGGAIKNSTGKVSMKNALDIARRFSRKKKAHGGRVGYEEGGEVLPLGMDFTPEHVRRAELGGHRHVASSANTPLGDVFARYTGSVDAGRNASNLENAAGTVLDTAYQFTGVPLAAEAGQNMARAVETGDTLRGLGAAGEMGMAMVPAARPVRQAITSSGMLGRIGTGAVMGGAPVLASGALSSEAQSAGPDDGLTPELRARRDVLQKKQTGDRRNASQTLNRAEREELNAINNMTAEFLRERNQTRFAEERRKQETVEGERSRQVNEAVAARDKIRNEAPKPFNEEFPTLSAIMPFAPLALGAATGALWGLPKLRGEQAALGRWENALDRANATTSPRIREQMIDEAAAANRSWPAATGRDKFSSYLAPMTVAGAEGAAVPNLPYAYNAIRLPEQNPERTAQQEYYRRLPEDHPERARTQELLNNESVLPTSNPPFVEARDYFSNLTEKALPRALAGAGEAMAFSLPGTTVTNAFRPYERALPRAQTEALERELATRRGPATPLRSGTAPDLPALPPPPAALPAPARAAEPPPASLAPPEGALAPRTSVSTEPSKPPHHSNFQPRDGGRWAPGKPKLPKPKKGRRASREDDVPPDHDPNSRLLTGRKHGGLVNSALDIARRFMGGRTWAPEVRPELPEAQFTYDERASRPLNLDLPMGLRETAITRERFPARELPDASDPLRGVGPQPPYAHGGSVSDGPVAGPVKGPTGGRADALPISVKSGAYVIPSDVVSGLPGAGNNTDAGMHLLEQMFGKAAPEARAAGGAIPDVPILISHGEFVISPEQVAKVGNGSMEHGHRVLDAFVKKMRAENIKHLRSLPGPAQS